MNEKTRNLLDNIVSRKQNTDLKQTDEPVDEVHPLDQVDEEVDGIERMLRELLREATNKIIEAAHDAVKPFPIPKKMLENIRNGVRPVMSTYLTLAFQLGGKENVS